MFKQIYASVVLASAMLLMTGAAIAAPIEIAVNGGFETGDFTSWALFPGSLGPAGQEVSAVNPSAGTWSGHLTEPAPAANIIKQANLRPGEFSVGQTIDISFDYRGTASAGGVLFAELFSEISGGGVSKSEILGGSPLFPNADPDIWTSVMFSGTTGTDTSGGITLQFNAACGADGGCVSDYFIDNVSIMADVAVIPVPAAVWLFGSALGLLGWMRRRVS